MSEPYIAEVRIFGFNFAPRGWAFCNGQLLPIAQNTALFSLIGVTYGGDGRTTTALPNIQARAAMHPGRGPGLTNRRLGEIGGTGSETLTEAQMASHRHTVRALSDPADLFGPADRSIARSRNGAAYKTPTSPATGIANMHNDTLPKVGGDPVQAHENRQPYQVLNFCIALVGLYPSRG